jgi:hypothetical protein
MGVKPRQHSGASSRSTKRATARRSAKGRKKVVGDQPICTEDEVRRIDPVWIPGPAPWRYWEDRHNRRNYLLWLGWNLGFRKMKDWYRLNSVGPLRNHVRGLLNHWPSYVDAVRECHPEYDWQGWLFPQVPARFWEVPANRRRYLLWLGERLGFREMDDWYALTVSDLQRNCGARLCSRHWRSSPMVAVKECFPGHEWHEWLFAHVPRGFWDVRANRHQFMRWLGRQLGFRRPRDWYRICQNDIEAHGGRTLLKRCPSMYDLMQEYLPQLDWSPFRRGSPLSAEQILQRADEYFAQHGRWPTKVSGPIPGTSISWYTVNSRLRCGCCSFRAGSSLPQFLAQHRGVPQGKTPPPLTEKQIVAWAEAHFAEQGCWPRATSGAVAGSRETWLRIDAALRIGLRGLRGGSSLHRFLKRHGLK